MLDERRRLLFLSYWVPPRQAIGSLRSTNVIKHLPDLGWDVTTVTAGWNSNRDNSTKLAEYVETGYFDLKGFAKRLAGIGTRSTSEALNLSGMGQTKSALSRFIAVGSGVLTYPDDYIGWLPFALGTIRKMLASRKWDLFLTTSPPVTTNLAAALAGPRVPWVADLRDLWAEDDSTEHCRLRAYLDDKLERVTLSRATALTAASKLSAARFRRRYPAIPCYAVSNGFDAEEWLSVEFGIEKSCTLLYAGNLYGGKRDPSLLFAALHRIFSAGLVDREDLRVDFYAPPEPWLMQLVAKFDLADVVNIRGFIDRRALLRAQRRANRLLALAWDGPTAEGVVAGKLFEYFGARRPVLAIGGPLTSAVEDLVRQTSAGVRCRTEEEVISEILLAVREHQSGNPRVVAQAAVEEYTGEACAKRFADVFDHVLRDYSLDGRIRAVGNEHIGQQFGDSAGANDS